MESHKIFSFVSSFFSLSMFLKFIHVVAYITSFLFVLIHSVLLSSMQLYG